MACSCCDTCILYTLYEWFDFLLLPGGRHPPLRLDLSLTDPLPNTPTTVPPPPPAHILHTRKSHLFEHGPAESELQKTSKRPWELTNINSVRPTDANKKNAIIVVCYEWSTTNLYQKNKISIYTYNVRMPYTKKGDMSFFFFLNRHMNIWQGRLRFKHLWYRQCVGPLGV